MLFMVVVSLSVRPSYTRQAVEEFLDRHHNIPDKIKTDLQLGALIINPDLPVETVAKKPCRESQLRSREVVVGQARRGHCLWRRSGKIVGLREHRYLLRGTIFIPFVTWIVCSTFIRLMRVLHLPWPGHVGQRRNDEIDCGPRDARQLPGPLCFTLCALGGGWVAFLRDTQQSAGA